MIKRISLCVIMLTLAIATNVMDTGSRTASAAGEGRVNSFKNVTEG